MRVFASIQFPSDLRKKAEQRVERQRKNAWKALVEGGILIHREAVLSVASISPGSNTRVRYSRTGQKRIVQAAPEGSSPNTDTGRLLQGIRMVPNEAKMEVQVGTDVKHGLYLELGFIGPDGKKRQWPWLDPAYQKHKDAIIAAVKKALGFG